MAVPAHRALGSTVHAANSVANPTSLTPTKGGSTVNGDLLVCWTWCRSITATVGTPSGWDLGTGFPKRSATASGGSIYVFTRIADGSGSDGPTVTWTGVTTGTSGDTSSAVILSVQNAVGTLDHSAIAFSDLAAQTNTSTIPDVTSLHDQAYAVHLTFKFVESGTSTQTTYTERTDAVTTNGSGNCSTTGSVTKATAGAVGTGTVTWSNTTSARALSCAIALRNAPTTVTVTPATTADAPQSDMFPHPPTNPTISWGTGGTGGNSATCTAPSVTEGDLLLLLYRSIAGTAFSPIITGGASGQWTTLYSDDSGTSAQGRGTIYAKIAEVGDGGTYTITGPVVGAGDHVVVNIGVVRVGRGNTINRIKNVETDAPHDASGATHTISGITTKKDNDLVVLMVTGDGALGRDTYAGTDPAVLTETTQVVTATGLDGFITSASALRTTKGATGSYTYNSTTASTADGARILIGITTASFIEKPVTISVVTETDSARTLFVFKVTPVSETDTAITLVYTHSLSVTPATETDSARTLSITGVTLTPAAETDSSIALAYGLDIHAYDIVTATETSSAQVLSYYKTVTITQAGDTAAAQTESAQKELSVSTAAEADTGQAVTFYRSVDITRATESDSSIAISYDKHVDLTVASESDSAQTLLSGKLYDIVHAAETDSAQVVTPYHAVGITTVTETDSALAQSISKAYTISPASEADSAQAQTFYRAVTITPATETDEAVHIVVKADILVTITSVAETDAAIAISFVKPLVKTITPVSEVDAARILHYAHAPTLTPATESDSVLSVTDYKTVEIGFVVETDSAETPAISHIIPFDLVTETDSAIVTGHHFEFIGGVDGHIVTGGILEGSEPSAREGFAEDPEHGAEPHEGGVRFARKGYVH